MSEPLVFNYTPGGETLRQFMVSNAFVRALRGPIGSGKSGCCCAELFRRASQQMPDPKTKARRTRWAVIRNTGPDLERTTIKTWLDWFPEAVFGAFKYSPPKKHHIKIGPLPDGTSVDMEVYFIALDKPEDIDTLYSLELTGAWVNEARFVPRKVISTLCERVNRYPAKKDGGITWAGVLLDTNSPDAEHWWAIMSGDKPPPEWMGDDDKLTMVKPPNWEFFAQPPAMVERYDAKGVIVGYDVNPAAENLKNLEANYYPQAIQGKTRSEIEVNFLNRYGKTFDGKAVFPSYRPEVHGATDDLLFMRDLEVYVGIDFGRTPAAIFAQRRMLRWFVLRELVTNDMSAQTFGRLLKVFMAQHFGGARFRIFGDPAGDQRAQTRDETPFDVLRVEGVRAFPAPGGNDAAIRVEAVESVINRSEAGLPCLQISKRCPVLRAAMEGGYHYARVRTSDGERYQSEPFKDRYSHPAEAFEYLLLGGGEGRLVTRGGTPAKPVVATRGAGVWARHDQAAVRASPWARR